MLRLVWPTDDDEPEPPAGYTTEVRLPLRPGVDADALLATAADGAVDLLLALPQLREITVGSRTLSRREADGLAIIGDARWQVARRSGTLGAELLAGLGVEQRSRRGWSLAWLVPVDAAGSPRPVTGDVLHAPTPTEERLSLPARLVATVPLEPSRRRTRPGPVADAVLAAAGPGYVELVRALPAADRAALVPAVGFPESELDAAVRERVLAALRSAAWLPGADGTELAPRDAIALDLPDPELPGLLAAVVPGLVAAGAASPAAVAALGIPRLGAAQLLDRLAGLDRPPRWWRSVYAALQRSVDQGYCEIGELGALPVPLVDGRTVIGPASAAIRAGGFALPDQGLELPGLRVVHPDAEHPLLTRLGARRLGPGELLDSPALVAAVEQSVDDAEAGTDVGPLAGAVLALVGQVGASGRPWLAALALPTVDGEYRRADELVLPDAAIRPVLDADAPLGVLALRLAGAAPREVLTAVGVLDGFAVLVDEHPTGPDHDLADEERWWAGVVAASGGEPPSRLVAVRDLDLVADGAWPAALRLLASDPACRAALLPGADRAPGGSYTAWWLSRHARLDGRSVRHWRLRSAAGLDGLYDVAELSDVDDDVLTAIGVRADARVADRAEAADLLARLADPGRRLGAATTVAAYRSLGEAVVDGRLDPEELEPPTWVRAVDGAVVDAERAVVVDHPWLADALAGTRQSVAGGDPAALAELLDLPLASEIVRGEVVSAGEPRRWADLYEVVSACAAAGVDVPDGEVRLYDVLEVQLDEPVPGRRSVPVWRDAAGGWHASDPVRALLARLTVP